MIQSRSFYPQKYFNAINGAVSEYLYYKKVLQLSVLMESMLSLDVPAIC